MSEGMSYRLCRCGQELQAAQIACDRCRRKHDSIDAEIAKKFPAEHTPLMFEEPTQTTVSAAQSGGGS